MCQVVRYVTFIGNKHPQKSINILIETEKLKINKSNREHLIPIKKMIIPCGWQNKPLKGHRDNVTLSDEIVQEKFRALSIFWIDSGDSSLHKYYGRQHQKWIPIFAKLKTNITIYIIKLKVI